MKWALFAFLCLYLVVDKSKIERVFVFWRWDISICGDYKEFADSYTHSGIFISVEGNDRKGKNGARIQNERVSTRRGTKEKGASMLNARILP